MTTTRAHGWLVLSCVVLACAACGEAAVQAATLNTNFTIYDLTFRLTTEPATPIEGENTMDVFVTDAQGQPVTDANLWFAYDMTNMSHGKQIVTANAQGDGHYRGTADFMMPGPWRVTAIVERPGHPAVDAIFDFAVASR